jgi:hypothetical protein
MIGRLRLVPFAVDAWKDASRHLGIRVVAPFALSAGHVTAACIAFLPDFGGQNGMVVGALEPSELEPDPALVECARTLGMFYSFLNLEKYSTFDPEVFKDALADWGYFGAAESRPTWLPPHADVASR